MRQPDLPRTSMVFDTDIEAMSLSVEEKNGLQIHRNYSRSFEKKKVEEFALSVVPPPGVLADCQKVLKLMFSEEPRTLPVIACAFADDQLKEMFRRHIPKDVPGGPAVLLSGYGPLSSLSHRVQMAYAFGWLNTDILLELDLLRKMRNDVSHKWDLNLLETKLLQFIADRQEAIEERLAGGAHFSADFHKSLLPVQKLRLRLCWLLGRITYETQLWCPALERSLQPDVVLYSEGCPPFLGQVAGACVEATYAFLRSEGLTPR
jgi:hypothetical protein